MNVEFRESFAKDLKDVKDKGLLKRVKEIIEVVEKAGSLAEISNLKKLKGSGNYFRYKNRRLSGWHCTRKGFCNLCPFPEQKRHLQVLPLIPSLNSAVGLSSVPAWMVTSYPPAPAQTKSNKKILTPSPRL